MPRLNWRKYQDRFEHLSEEILSEQIPAETSLLPRLIEICHDDSAADLLILGAEAPLLAYLEFLFARAEGPYSPLFVSYSRLITLVFRLSFPLKTLLDLNAADAIGNMILNRRGRLKFVIADDLELSLLLERWPMFGLHPVTERQVFDAILKKSDISHRLSSEDPDLLVRLLEVFPQYQSEFIPAGKTREGLIVARQDQSPLPSQRRYHRLYTRLLEQGYDVRQMIRDEEQRVLPIQMRRNTFLSFLVKQLHGGECQICALTGQSNQAGKSPITVHHIIPLSEGGSDTGRNMLVVCMSHHKAIHDGRIDICLNDMIEVRCDTSIYQIEPNL
nr:HNH endonuclease signature motif containing protein [uncultured Methanospirillum sp.]